jgi:hypothetical protein
MITPSVIMEDYDQEYDCIRIDELRDLLRLCKRHSAYYTYFLLRASTDIIGIQPEQQTLQAHSPLQTILTTFTSNHQKPPH